MVENPTCLDDSYVHTLGRMEDACMKKETIPSADVGDYASCNMIYVNLEHILDTANHYSPKQGIENKDLSDRFLTTLILNLIVCLANIGLALFGFLLFRTPGDF